MYWPGWRELGLWGWSAWNLWAAQTHTHWSHGHQLWLTLTFHGTLIAVPWALWWARQPRRRLRDAANGALRLIRREAARLGPAFDELAVEAEILWRTCGVPALAQHHGALRELRSGPFLRARQPRRCEALEAASEAALANAERVVTALELLGAHLTRLRVTQIERASVDGRIAALQSETTRALAAHDEAAGI